MNVELILPLLLFLTCSLIGIIVFKLAKEDWSIDTDLLLSIYINEIEKSKKTLEEKNKEIDIIEEEILKYKKNLKSSRKRKK